MKQRKGLILSWLRQGKENEGGKNMSKLRKGEEGC